MDKLVNSVIKSELTRHTFKIMRYTDVQSAIPFAG